MNRLLVAKSGAPVNRWAIRAVATNRDSWKDVSMGDTLWRWAPHCAFCGRGAPYETAHSHEQCPFIGIQNKFRKQAGVHPLSITNGCVIRDDAHKSEDLEKGFKSLRERVDKLESRLSKAEALLSKQASAETDKKRKANAKAESGSGDKKKAKKDGGNDKGKGGGSGNGAAAKGKGKA